MFKIEDGRDRFYQWDLNRKLIVEDSTIPQVHFSNAIGDTAYVVNAVDGVVAVPNILLQQDCSLLVYGYDGEATKHTATFEVVGRNKPEDYIYSEEEIKNYDALEKRIEELEKGGGGSGSDISLGITSANPGQTVMVLKTNSEGKPTKWEAVEFPETAVKDWELINYIEIPEGAEESNALTINQDESGTAFRLKKATLFCSLPPYTGEATPPNHSFFMLNGETVGANAPYAYTNGLIPPAKSSGRFGTVDVDLTLPGFQRETVARSNLSSGTYFGPAKIDAVTSIGGTAMLIYPGCKFWLYGVRE